MNADAERILTGISSIATRHLLSELAEAYGKKAGVQAQIVSVGGVEAAKRIEQGEAFDFVVLAADAIERLAAGDKVDPASRRDVVRSGIAIAVAAGAPHPDIKSEASLRDAVARARAVGYSTGPSGTYLVRLFERWGIKPQLVQAAPGVPVGTLVARGEVDLGLQQLSELMNLPGIDVVGMMPPEVQLMTVFSGAVCKAAKRPAEAATLLAYLASPETAAGKWRHGMEPA